MDKKVTILIDFDYCLFDTEKFVRFLLNSPSDIDYKDFLYPDALEFINYAAIFGNLVLFSEGEVDFQKEKIEGTGIDKLFSGGVKIFPSYEKIQELSSFTAIGKVILIDDKPEVVDVAILKGCRVIRIRRGKYFSVESKNKPDFEVTSLSEIVSKDILRSI